MAARVGLTNVKISELASKMASEIGVAGQNQFKLSSYRRTANTLSGTVVWAPTSGPLSMGRLRGAFSSAPAAGQIITTSYRNLNVYASSSTTGVNVFPGNYFNFNNNTYQAGISNLSDSANAYTLREGQATGNFGHATTCNTYRQSVYTDGSLGKLNVWNFRVCPGSIGAGFPWGGIRDNPSDFCIAIGINYYLNTANAFQGQLYSVNYTGAGNAIWTFTNPPFLDIFNGSNFLAAWSQGGIFYMGLVNRAQLRAGVIQPVSSSNYGDIDLAFWHNGIPTIVPRYSLWANPGPGILDATVGWDEYILRGYNLPNSHRMYGFLETATFNDVTNNGTFTTIFADNINRIFE